ncbi:MAG: glycosyltransferase, partial [Verrucomicrobiales bacterium]|nr:glycosyltransferase [Verrucomicrobiales bacterium]
MSSATVATDSPAPVVSVLLPVRDGAATLGRAIDSIHAQTFPAWELLVVDDGSTDDTAAVAGALAREDSRVRLTRIPPAGIVAALAAGL